jgi:hypothetical protein
MTGGQRPAGCVSSHSVRSSSTAGPGGGPHVRNFDGATGTVVREWMAYDVRFSVGVFVAADDVTGDDVPDVVTAAGPGGGPHVKLFDGDTGSKIYGLMVFAPAVRGGIFVGVG